jgi:hypothetical protein
LVSRIADTVNCQMQRLPAMVTACFAHGRQAAGNAAQKVRRFLNGKSGIHGSASWPDFHQHGATKLNPVHPHACAA